MEPQSPQEIPDTNDTLQLVFYVVPLHIGVLWQFSSDGSSIGVLNIPWHDKEFVMPVVGV